MISSERPTVNARRRSRGENTTHRRLYISSERCVACVRVRDLPLRPLSSDPGEGTGDDDRLSDPSPDCFLAGSVTACGCFSPFSCAILAFGSNYEQCTEFSGCVERKRIQQRCGRERTSRLAETSASAVYIWRGGAIPAL